MVVMEYIDGNTIAQIQAKPSKSLGLLDTELVAALETIMKLLHTRGFVYGDLRGPNVMVTPEKKIKLINFDWAGKAGYMKYPNFLSPQIPWPAGVGRGKPITAQHDLDMIPNILNLLRPWAGTGTRYDIPV
jgi:serine/threonine protein kinase